VPPVHEMNVIGTARLCSRTQSGRDGLGPAVQRLNPPPHLRRQMVDLYRRGSVPPLLGLLCACGLVGLLWPVLPGPVAASWLLAHGAVAAGRLLLVRRFNGERVADGQLPRWWAHYVNATLVGGLVWGVGSVLLVFGEPHVLQLLAWVVLGAAILVEFPSMARLGRPYAWLLMATLTGPLVLMLLGPQPLPGGAGALLLLACSSALAGMELHRTYVDGVQMQVEFARLARFDQLTGLANRRHFDETRSEEHTSELQSHVNLVCRLLL